jgi:hypothetical protein
MKKIVNILILFAAVTTLASCARSFAAPLMVTDNPVGTKKGVASKTVWFNIRFGDTDLGIAAAAKNGGITKVGTVDWKVEAKMLGLKTTYTIMVSGE